MMKLSHLFDLFDLNEATWLKYWKTHGKGSLLWKEINKEKPLKVENDIVCHQGGAQVARNDTTSRRSK